MNRVDEVNSDSFSFITSEFQTVQKWEHSNRFLILWQLVQMRNAKTGKCYLRSVTEQKQNMVFV